MKVLITGISGKLAQQVALELLARGHRVVGIDRRPWPECPWAAGYRPPSSTWPSRNRVCTSPDGQPVVAMIPPECSAIRSASMRPLT